MDEVDIANDYAQRLLDMQIASARAKANGKPAQVCDDCDDPLPQERQALNLRLCIECASLRERKARMFSKD